MAASKMAIFGKLAAYIMMLPLIRANLTLRGSRRSTRPTAILRVVTRSCQCGFSLIFSLSLVCKLKSAKLRKGLTEPYG